MAYIFKLNGVELPVTPGKLVKKVSGKNKTVDLVNGGEINQIKSSCLAEYSFECIIPQTNDYGRFCYDAGNFIELFKSLKERTEPFRFQVIRNNPNGTNLFDTDEWVTLEDYDITEDADNGFDLAVTVNLKEYREYGYRRLALKSDDSGKSTVTTSKVPKRPAREPAKTYKVVRGDTLLLISRKVFSESGYYKDIYTLNKAVIEAEAKKDGRKSSSSGHWLYPGTMLKMPKKKG